MECRHGGGGGGSQKNNAEEWGGSNGRQGWWKVKGWWRWGRGAKMSMDRTEREAHWMTEKKKKRQKVSQGVVVVSPLITIQKCTWWIPVLILTSRTERKAWMNYEASWLSEHFWLRSAFLNKHHVYITAVTQRNRLPLSLPPLFLFIYLFNFCHFSPSGGSVDASCWYFLWLCVF